MTQAPTTSARARVRPALRAFIASEAAGGVVLMGAAILAMVIANSGLAPAYFGALKAKLGPLTLGYWINDGLMALFFLLVGLEIKREALDGALSTPRSRVLPGFAALGGMIGPALVYVWINWGDPAALRGWAVPAATDIAFALGVLALLGRRVPVALKLLLTAIAIIDDLGAVLVIALFYTAELSLPALGGAALVLALLAGLNRAGAVRLAPYLALGVVLWLLVLASGVHATLAGVLLALTIPLRRTRDGVHAEADEAASPLHRLEHAIHPGVAFFVVPVFGFANAGLDLSGFTLASLLQPVTLGVAAGLVVGKQIGVFGLAAVAVRAGLAEKPAGVSWLQLYGLSLLCGIGFTMSLFIGLLAFPDAPVVVEAVKAGVLTGSLVAGLAGAGVLLLAPRPRDA